MKKICAVALLFSACVQPLPGEDSADDVPGTGGIATGTGTGGIPGRTGTGGGTVGGANVVAGRAGMAGSGVGGAVGGRTGGIVGSAGMPGPMPPPVGGFAVGNGLAPCQVIPDAATGSGPFMNAEVAGATFETAQTGTVLLALNNNGSGDVARVHIATKNVQRSNVSNVPISGIASFDFQRPRVAVAFGGKMPVSVFDTIKGIFKGSEEGMLDHKALSVAARANGQLLTLGAAEIWIWDAIPSQNPTKTTMVQRMPNDSGLLSTDAAYRFGFVDAGSLVVLNGSNAPQTRIPIVAGAIVQLLPNGAVTGTQLLQFWDYNSSTFVGQAPLSGTATGIAVHSKYGTTYVASTGTNQILSFDSKGAPAQTLVHNQQGTVAGSSLTVAPFESRVAAVVGRDLVIWCL